LILSGLRFPSGLHVGSLGSYFFRLRTFLCLCGGLRVKFMVCLLPPSVSIFSGGFVGLEFTRVAGCKVDDVCTRSVVTRDADIFRKSLDEFRCVLVLCYRVMVMNDVSYVVF